MPRPEQGQKEQHFGIGTGLFILLIISFYPSKNIFPWFWDLLAYLSHFFALPAGVLGAPTVMFFFLPTIRAHLCLLIVSSGNYIVCYWRHAVICNAGCDLEFELFCLIFWLRLMIYMLACSWAGQCLYRSVRTMWLYISFCFMKLLFLPKIKINISILEFIFRSNCK